MAPPKLLPQPVSPSEVPIHSKITISLLNSTSLGQGVWSNYALRKDKFLLRIDNCLNPTGHYRGTSQARETFLSSCQVVFPTLIHARLNCRSLNTLLVEGSKRYSVSSSISTALLSGTNACIPSEFITYSPIKSVMYLFMCNWAILRERPIRTDPSSPAFNKL